MIRANPEEGIRSLLIWRSLLGSSGTLILLSSGNSKARKEATISFDLLLVYELTLPTRPGLFPHRQVQMVP